MTGPAVLKCTWQAEVRQAHFLSEVSRCRNSRQVEETDGLALALDTPHLIRTGTRACIAHCLVVNYYVGKWIIF